jgi:hypothetical protein
MRAKSADIAHRVVRVATATETWLLFRTGLLPDDLIADLDDVLRDVQVLGDYSDALES